MINATSSGDTAVEGINLSELNRAKPSPPTPKYENVAGVDIGEFVVFLFNHYMATQEDEDYEKLSVDNLFIAEAYLELLDTRIRKVHPNLSGDLMTYLPTPPTSAGQSQTPSQREEAVAIYADDLDAAIFRYFLGLSR